MDSQLVHEQSGQRTFVVALTTGEEVMDWLVEFAERERISAAQISAIGRPCGAIGSRCPALPCCCVALQGFRPVSGVLRPLAFY
jgi:hypothetical protein